MHNLSGSWRHTAAMFTTAIAAATRRSDMCGYIWPNGALLFFALLCAIKSYLSKNRRREGGREKRKSRAFPSGHHVPIQESSRLPFSPPSFPSPKKAKDQESGREQAIWACAGTAWPPHALCPSSVRSQVPAWPLGLVAGLLCAWLGPSGARDLIGCIAVGLITRPPHSRTNNNSDNHKSDNSFSGIFGWKK